MSIIPILHMMKKSQKEREERYKKQQEEINKRFVRVATPLTGIQKEKPGNNIMFMSLVEEISILRAIKLDYKY